MIITSTRIRSCNTFTMSLMAKLKDYGTSIAGTQASFDSAVQRMLQTFNSIIRQNRVRKLPQKLRLSQILKTKNWSVSEGLQELRETITRYTPQGPKTHRSDPDKTECLHEAVIGTEWAKPVLTQSLASTPPWTFQQMYTALDAAWLQEQKQNEGRKRDPPQNAFNDANALWYTFSKAKYIRYTQKTWFVLVKPPCQFLWAIQTI